MIVEIEPGIKKETGSQVMFHVGGVAALTLLVNSVTTGPLLRILGLVKTEDWTNRVTNKLSTRILNNMKKTFEVDLNNAKDIRFYGASSEIVREMVPLLDSDDSERVETNLMGDIRTHQHLTFLNDQINMEWRLVQTHRE